MDRPYVCKFAHYSAAGEYIPLGHRITTEEFKELSFDKKLCFRKHRPLRDK